MKLNSGNKVHIGCMTACAIATHTVCGNWSAFLRSTLLAGCFLLAATVQAADYDVSRTLKGIEDRYNKTQALQLSFTETYRAQGRQRTEKGELYLRKPGRMRWQYTAPAGKLFVSDGKFIYSYTPQDNRAEKMKFKEADDMRAPLAFLLGRLNFSDDFREFRSHAEEGGVYITAIPKSDKLPYTEVSFLATPDYSIRRLEVKGQDNSVLQFTFENEKKDPAISEAMFRFTLPAGAEFVDSSTQ